MAKRTAQETDYAAVLTTEAVGINPEAGGPDLQVPPGTVGTYNAVNDSFTVADGFFKGYTIEGAGDMASPTAEFGEILPQYSGTMSFGSVGEWGTDLVRVAQIEPDRVLIEGVHNGVQEWLDRVEAEMINWDSAFEQLAEGRSRNASRQVEAESFDSLSLDHDNLPFMNLNSMHRTAEAEAEGEYAEALHNLGRQLIYARDAVDERIKEIGEELLDNDPISDGGQLLADEGIEAYGVQFDAFEAGVQGLPDMARYVDQLSAIPPQLTTVVLNQSLESDPDVDLTALYDALQGAYEVAPDDVKNQAFRELPVAASLKRCAARVITAAIGDDESQFPELHTALNNARAAVPGAYKALEGAVNELVSWLEYKAEQIPMEIYGDVRYLKEGALEREAGLNRLGSDSGEGWSYEDLSEGSHAFWKVGEALRSIAEHWEIDSTELENVLNTGVEAYDEAFRGIDAVLEGMSDEELDRADAVLGANKAPVQSYVESPAPGSMHVLAYLSNIGMNGVEITNDFMQHLADTGISEPTPKQVEVEFARYLEGPKEETPKVAARSKKPKLGRRVPRVRTASMHRSAFKEWGWDLGSAWRTEQTADGGLELVKDPALKEHIKANAKERYGVEI